MQPLQGSDKLRDAYPKINQNFTKLNEEKVEKVPGKSLSDNNYTNEEKNKLAAVYNTLAQEGDPWEVA